MDFREYIFSITNQKRCITALLSIVLKITSFQSLKEFYIMLTTV